jgi:16S rRNA (guanine527-N7)-methyltransferase
MPLAHLGAGFAPLVERVTGALANGRPLPPAFLDSACRLLDLTVAWNAKMDLTAAKSAEELVDLVFSDAVALFGGGYLDRGGAWLDVGSGSGVPGLPLALLEPRAQVTLLEPMQKRVAFLRTAVGALGVNAHVVRGRAEDRAAGSTEVAISRATLPPPEWLVEGARLATLEVWVLLAREPAPSWPGWSAHADVSFVWPLTGRARRLVGFRPG